MIINMQNRPFESVEEMDRILLQNYNSVVRQNDTVGYIIKTTSRTIIFQVEIPPFMYLNKMPYDVICNLDKP